MSTSQFDDLAFAVQIPSPTEASVDHAAVDFLFLHFVRDPEFFRRARPSVQPEYFDPAIEAEHLLLWAALCEADQDGVGFGREVLSDLVWEVHSRGIVPIADGQFDRLVRQDDDGLLHWCYSRLATELAPRRAWTILRRFLHQRTITLPLKRFFSNPYFPASDHLDSLLETARRQYRRIEALAEPPLRTIGDDWEGHEQQLQRLRGRQLVGLNTGFAQLNSRTCGLRGTTVFGAMPSIGKTTFALQIGLQVCQHHQENNAVTLFLSLEMSKMDLVTRIKSHLSGLDWRTVVMGSPILRDNAAGPYLTDRHCNLLRMAQQRAEQDQITQRFAIRDRSDLGDNLSVARIESMLEQLKARTSASRALIVIDYLQRMEVPDRIEERGEMAADKYRVALIQDLVEVTKTEANPLGDAVLVISEARKPTNTAQNRQNHAWGAGLAELMGTARVAYAADAVLLYRVMTDEDLERFYQMDLRRSPGDQRDNLFGQGISPVVLTLEKGRDGTERGEIAMEYNFRQSTFSELGGVIGAEDAVAPLPGQLRAAQRR